MSSSSDTISLFAQHFGDKDSILPQKEAEKQAVASSLVYLMKMDVDYPLILAEYPDFVIRDNRRELAEKFTHDFDTMDNAQKEDFRKQVILSVMLTLNAQKIVDTIALTQRFKDYLLAA